MDGTTVRAPRPALGRRIPVVGILILAAAVRLAVVTQVPDLYGPGDPGIYLALARGWAHVGAPRIDFIHHLLTRPATIAHLEDYYEPAFGLWLALPVAIADALGARLLLCACSLLTVWCVWRLARPWGAAASGIAAAIVALEPWSAFYGGLLMKEALVALLVVGCLAALMWVPSAPWSAARAGAALAACTLVATLFQYEMLPVIAGATGVVLLARRRAALPSYLALTIAGVAVLAAITWLWIGVPISAKYRFFLSGGVGLGDVSETPVAGVSRFLPFETIGREIIACWHPVLLLLAAIGATGIEARRYALPWAAFTIAWLYVHGVPHDLWERDFVPLTAIAAPLAGLALSDRARARTWRLGPAVALAALTFATFTALRHVIGLPLDEGRTMFWPAAHLTLTAALLVFAAGFAMRDRLPWMRGGVPFLLGVALAVSVWGRLPLTVLTGNPEFPGRDAELARIDRIARRVVATVPRGPLMAAAPVEWHLSTGWPAVRLPEPADRSEIEALHERYAVRYLLVAPEDLPDSVRRGLPLVERARSEEETLYEFATVPTAVAPARRPAYNAAP